MASMNQCLASLARLSLVAPAARPTIPTTIPRFLVPAATTAQHAGYATVRSVKKEKKKRKTSKTYRVNRLDRMPQFSLCDAMRYARAYEVGQDPTVIKYELALRLKALRNGTLIKSRIRLPHVVRSDRRIGVICKENSALAIKARAAGAVAVGEESLFEQLRAGSLNLTSLICDQGSAEALTKANLGRLLGPKGLMPSVRTKTITTNVLSLLKEMSGADSYRENQGVVRIAIGQLGFTPSMLADNVRAFVAQVKDECAKLQELENKEIHEVVLSTTRGPGFSLNGSFNPTTGITPAMLTGPM